MKKFSALVLALCMLFTLMATGMGEGLEVGTYDPATAGDYELSFAWWGNQVRDGLTLEVTELFHEHYPNVTFNNNAQNWSNYWTLMTTNAANNDLPDVMQQSYTYIVQWAEAGDLLDLTPYIESGALDLSNFPESVINTGKVGDGVYAICAGMNAPSLIYNKTLTDSLGIEVPLNLTWDQFVEISKEIYEKTGVGVVYGEGNTTNVVSYYARSQGAIDLWGEEGSLLTAEQLAGYYQNLIDGVADGWLYDTDKIAAVNINDIAQNPVVYGSSPEVRTWCTFNWSNQIAAFQAAATANDIELGISTWPSSDPVASNFLQSSQFFSITTDCKNVDLAVAFLNYLVNDIQANTILRAERGVPASGVVAAAIADVVSEQDATYPIVVEYLAFVGDGNCSDIYPPQPSYVGEAQESVLKLMSDEMLLKNPQMTAMEAAEYAVENINEIASGY